MDCANLGFSRDPNRSEGGDTGEDNCGDDGDGTREIVRGYIKRTGRYNSGMDLEQQILMLSEEMRQTPNKNFELETKLDNAVSQIQHAAIIFRQALDTKAGPKAES